LIGVLETNTALQVKKYGKVHKYINTLLNKMDLNKSNSIALYGSQ